MDEKWWQELKKARLKRLPGKLSKQPVARGSRVLLMSWKFARETLTSRTCMHGKWDPATPSWLLGSAANIRTRTRTRISRPVYAHINETRKGIKVGGRRGLIHLTDIIIIFLSLSSDCKKIMRNTANVRILGLHICIPSLNAD